MNKVFYDHIWKPLQKYLKKHRKSNLLDTNNQMMYKTGKCAV